MTADFSPLDRGTYVLFSDRDRLAYVGRVVGPVENGARIWTDESAASATAVLERPSAMVTEVVTGQQRASVVAPELLVDPQDTEERFAALVVHGRDAVVDLLTFLTPIAESVRDQSVTTGAVWGPNHNGDTGSDLPVCFRWVAPPSGLERIRSSSGRVVGGASPSPIERESRASVGTVVGPDRGWSASIRDQTCDHTDTPAGTRVRPQ